MVLLKISFLLLYLLFLYWHILENWWAPPLPQVLYSEVRPFGVYNCKQFGRRWRPFSYLLVFFMCQKNMVSSPFTFSPNLFDRRPNSLAKYFTHVVLFLARLNGCLYLSDSPVASSMIYFSSILRYWCSEMSSGVFWEWDSMIPGPISLYTFLAIFMSRGGFMYLLGGRALHGMSPPLVTNTHFRPSMG